MDKRTAFSLVFNFDDFLQFTTSSFHLTAIAICNVIGATYRSVFSRTHYITYTFCFIPNDLANSVKITAFASTNVNVGCLEYVHL